MLIYLNDILIFFSDSLKNHCQKIIIILKWLQQTDLQINIDKCEFKTTFTKYLEFIVKVEKDVSMNSDKIKIILKWEQSQFVKSVRFFLNFTNFYWWFIKNFFKVVTLLMNLIKKNVMFHWSNKINKAFKWLKNIFIIVLILMQFNLNCEIVIEADFSKYVINNLLQQYDNNSVLQSYAFFFKKNLLTKCNYEIYDKKLLIIVLYLKE